MLRSCIIKLEEVDKIELDLFKLIVKSLKRHFYQLEILSSGLVVMLLKIISRLQMIRGVSYHLIESLGL